MELKEIAKIIAKRYVCQSVERQLERDQERTCSLELSSILKELDSLQESATDNCEMIDSVMKINNQLTVLTDCFEEIGFQKGFLYGLAFTNEIGSIHLNDI